jgi:hypothetical protein
MLDALRAYQDTKPVVRIDVDGSGRAAAPSEDDAFRHTTAVAIRWREIRRETPSVMGPRLGLKVAFGQSASGGFAVRPGLVTEDLSAADALVREVVKEAERLDGGQAVTIMTSGGVVAIADDGAFTVLPTETVVLRAGRGATRVHVPCAPPLKERRLE